MDGRELEVPDIPENREWPITTIEGVYAGDVPDSLQPGVRRTERYLRVDNEYVHETLVTEENDPPDDWMPPPR